MRGRHVLASVGSQLPKVQSGIGCGNSWAAGQVSTRDCMHLAHARSERKKGLSPCNAVSYIPSRRSPPYRASNPTLPPSSRLACLATPPSQRSPGLRSVYSRLCNARLHAVPRRTLLALSRSGLSGRGRAHGQLYNSHGTANTTTFMSQDVRTRMQCPHHVAQKAGKWPAPRPTSALVRPLLGHRQRTSFAKLIPWVLRPTRGTR
jgi:hypothetical protein